MKKNLLSLFLTFLIVNSFAQTSVPGGVVSGTWSLIGSPYNIQGDIMIANNTTLSIDPGVTVNFQGHYKLLVLGQLVAIGTTTDTITFTSADTTNGWKGIRFENTTNNNDISQIIFCKVQYGKEDGSGSGWDGVGGAFLFVNFSNAIISNCNISKNRIAFYSGGAIYLQNSSPTISNSIITDNSAGSQGGGIVCMQGSPIITNNIIYNNSAGFGGGIYCDQSGATISNNIISNNTAGEGGGIIFRNEYGVLNNNVISNNIASTGGGIHFDGSSPTFTNNTITNNNADLGGAIYCKSPFSASNPVFNNCIFWGNSATTSGAQVYLYDEQSDPDFYFCNVQGSSSSFGLNGVFYLGTYSNNINVDPLFVSPSGGSGIGFNGVVADWSLQNTSPCIDAGDPNGTYPTTDIVGNPRIVGSIIDVGAYEYQGPISIVYYDLVNTTVIYPNPFNYFTSIQLNQNLFNAELNIFDQFGQLIKTTTNISGDRIRIDRHNLAAGLYFFRLTQNNKAIATNKLIIVD